MFLFATCQEAISNREMHSLGGKLAFDGFIPVGVKEFQISKIQGKVIFCASAI